MRRMMWGPLAALVLLLGACGDDGGDPGATATTEPTPSSVTEPEPERPEGIWTLVTVQLARTDAPEFDPGTAVERLVEFTPQCESGLCDIAVEPAGADGTFLPDGDITPAGAPAAEPFTFVWNEAEDTLSVTTETEPALCTTAELEEIVDGYLSTRTTTLTFEPAAGDRPARLTGTYENRVEPNPDAEADGCTAFTESGTLTGVPTGALDFSDVDVDGEYVATESVIEVLPDSRPPGFRGLLGRFSIEGSVITGVLGVPAELDGSSSERSGATAETLRPCPTDPETPDGFTDVETFTDLHVVGLTDAGTPIVSGRWRYDSETTDAGSAAGCEASSNEGYLILVPVDVLG